VTRCGKKRPEKENQGNTPPAFGKNVKVKCPMRNLKKRQEKPLPLLLLLLLRLLLLPNSRKDNQRNIRKMKKAVLRDGFFCVLVL
jgi:hypothetical protein